MERGFACADPPQLAKPLKPEAQPANTRSSAVISCVTSASDV